MFFPTLPNLLFLALCFMVKKNTLRQGGCRVMLNDVMYEWEQFPLGFYDLMNINELLSQLALDPSKPSPQLSSTRMMEMRARQTEIIVARDSTRKHVDGKDAIIAMTTVFPILTMSNTFALVEDVVVDGHYHRQGIGEMINRYVIVHFRFLGFNYLELHSHIARIPAHTMYEKIGYKLVAEGPERKYYRFHL